MRRRRAWRAAVAGVDWVIHAGARVSTSGRGRSSRRPTCAATDAVHPCRRRGGRAARRPRQLAERLCRAGRRRDGHRGQRLRRRRARSAASTRARSSPPTAWRRRRSPRRAGDDRPARACCTVRAARRRWHGARSRSGRCACCSRSREYLLPLAYVDNVADALVLAARSAGGARTRLHHRRRARAPGRLCAPLSRGRAAASWMPVYVPLGAAARGGRGRRGAGRRCSVARSPITRHQVERTLAQRDVRHPAGPATSSAGAARAARRGACDAASPCRRRVRRPRRRGAIGGMSAAEPASAVPAAHRARPHERRCGDDERALRRSLQRRRARRLAHRALSSDPRHGSRPLPHRHGALRAEGDRGRAGRTSACACTTSRDGACPSSMRCSSVDGYRRAKARRRGAQALRAARQTARLLAEELPAALALARVIRRERADVAAPRQRPARQLRRHPGRLC